ncbi:ST8 alpha-N-acetyl-neuraminide alpha-2,8-sialyltransferase 5 [Homo sapiens]|uniref:ST8 alpha-N-acetyl-neuraminide alpha-2,8-sialyltransferase 5 n=1 Tax=Homo sapiens TaxID=9606 RepID=K7ER54_HUMAN|nr:ST8 alpha-N-acetyl-neuraminide alpha-2,8-sialyltransferase 5 [Homo sapiens]KAI4046175.1 ST8 alpha-N-acetyl-neuraminide alpha-2,8-sialyltransferase 5 [Homo sapiens]
MVVVGTNEQVPLPRSQPACVCGRKNLISESQDLLLGTLNFMRGLLNITPQDAWS